MKNIYNLKMFETDFIFDDEHSKGTSNGVKVRRVPGGWTFTEWESSFEESANQTRISSVFVPYSDEYKQKPNPNMSDPLVM